MNNKRKNEARHVGQSEGAASRLPWWRSKSTSIAFSDAEFLGDYYGPCPWFVVPRQEFLQFCLSFVKQTLPLRLDNAFCTVGNWVYFIVYSVNLIKESNKHFFHLSACFSKVQVWFSFVEECFESVGAKKEKKFKMVANINFCANINFNNFV